MSENIQDFAQRLKIRIILLPSQRKKAMKKEGENWISIKIKSRLKKDWKALWFLSTFKIMTRSLISFCLEALFKKDWKALWFLSTFKIMLRDKRKLKNESLLLVGWVTFFQRNFWCQLLFTNNTETNWSIFFASPTKHVSMPLVGKLF